jgi:hypothetical protein
MSKEDRAREKKELAVLTSNGNRKDRQLFWPRHPEAYAVVIMKDRDKSIFRGGAGAYWSLAAMSDGGSWTAFDEIPAWVEHILLRHAAGEHYSLPGDDGFDQAELEEALEFAERGEIIRGQKQR